MSAPPQSVSPFDTPIAPDPLAESLHHLRMSGSFYALSELSAPWGLVHPADGRPRRLRVVSRSRGRQLPGRSRRSARAGAHLGRSGPHPPRPGAHLAKRARCGSSKHPRPGADAPGRSLRVSPLRRRGRARPADLRCGPVRAPRGASSASRPEQSAERRRHQARPTAAFHLVDEGENCRPDRRFTIAGMRRGLAAAACIGAVALPAVALGGPPDDPEYGGKVDDRRGRYIGFDIKGGARTRRSRTCSS